MQTLEGFLHRLVAGEASRFMVAGAGVHGRHGEIGAGLLQPVGGAVHGFIVGQALRLKSEARRSGFHRERQRGAERGRCGRQAVAASGLGGQEGPGGDHPGGAQTTGHGCMPRSWAMAAGNSSRSRRIWGRRRGRRGSAICASGWRPCGLASPATGRRKRTGNGSCASPCSTSPMPWAMRRPIVPLGWCWPRQNR